MNHFFLRLSRLFRPPTPVPPEYRQRFLHLYLDIAWWGILSGTTMAFLAVYATRQGASTQQIALLSAAPALVNLLVALPAGRWLSRRPIGRTVFRASLAQRLFYLILIPLPVLLIPAERVWVIIITTLLINIPGTAASVGFNSIFGEVVPLEWRGQVVGIRNALLSIVTTVFTLLSGEILTRLGSPVGYQVVFGMGVAGAFMSSIHLYYLSRTPGLEQIAVVKGEIPRVETAEARRLSEEIRAIAQRSVQNLRLDAMVGRYGRIMGLLFAFHLIQYLTIPVVTPFVVNELHLSDQTIGLGGSVFNATMFVGSLGLSGVTRRFGNKTITALGIMGMSFFPGLTALGPGGYVAGNLAGGIAWALAGGALYNYILENIPPADRPAHMAWYSLVSNAAILVGSMTGPLIAGQIGFSTALIIFGVLRLISGLSILRWG